MTKARTLANLISDNAELADGQISVAEVVGAAPSANPTFTGNIDVGDDVKIRLGASDDLNIFHDGQHSYIQESGFGALKLKGEDIRLEDDDGNNIIKATSTAAELYYSGAKKLETSSTGIDVNNSGQSQSLVSIGGGSTNAALTLRGSTGSAYAWQVSSNAHVASALEFTKSTAVGGTTFSTPSMVINSSGNVGIGLSTNISSKLHVNSELSLGPDNNNRMIVGSTSGGVGSIGTIEGGTTSFSTMTFTGGSVGIGVTNPSSFNSGAYNLVVGSTSASSQGITIAADTNSIMYFADGTSGAEAYMGSIVYNHTNNDMTFRTNGFNTALVIDSSQNVLVGGTNNSPATNNVAGSSHGSLGNIQASVDGNPCLFVNRKSSDGTIVSFRKDGSAVGSIGAKSGQVYMADTAAGIRFSGHSTDDVQPCDGNGADKANVNLGASGNAWGDLFLSGGVRFSGAANSSVLDDYEEGSFSPTLKKGSLTSFTYVSQIGKYTRIGNQVKISFYIFCNNTGTTNNGASWEITNLPFNISHLTNCAYQFVPCGYLLIGNVQYESNSHQHRWQANTSTTLTLYGQRGSTEHTGSNLEFSGTGILTIA